MNKVILLSFVFLFLFTAAAFANAKKQVGQMSCPSGYALVVDAPPETKISEDVENEEKDAPVGNEEPTWQEETSRWHCVLRRR